MEKITTKQAFSLLSLINKMNLKNGLLKLIKSMQRLEQEKQFVLSKLYSMTDLDEGEEVTNELVVKLFTENKDLHEEYKQCEEEEQENSLEFILDVITALPQAEKEFYKTMANIFNKTIKEVEEEDLTITVQNVMDIFKSPTFMGFFKSMNK